MWGDVGGRGVAVTLIPLVCGLRQMKCPPPTLTHIAGIWRSSTLCPSSSGSLTCSTRCPRRCCGHRAWLGTARGRRWTQPDPGPAAKSPSGPRGRVRVVLCCCGMCVDHHVYFEGATVVGFVVLLCPHLCLASLTQRCTTLHARDCPASKSHACRRLTRTFCERYGRGGWLLASRPHPMVRLSCNDHKLYTLRSPLYRTPFPPPLARRPQLSGSTGSGGACSTTCPPWSCLRCASRTVWRWWRA